MPAVHRYVGRQLVEIGERQQVVGEVGVVVPDVKLIGDLRPGLQVLHEVGVAVALLVWVGLAGGDGAEANPHVRPRPRLRRRRLSVLVGQRVDELVGMLLLDLLRQRVDEAQQRAGVRAAFFLLDAAAAVALAPAGPVVLRHREDGRLGMLADPAEHRLHRQPQHLRIGEAELPAIDAPLAVDQREVLGMRGEVLLRRDHPVEGVHERKVPDFVAGGFVKLRAVAVGLVAGRPVLVERLGEERLAVLEGGPVRFIERSEGYGVHLGDAADLAGEPAAAELLQQRVDAVHRPALAAPGDDEVAPGRLQHEVLGAELLAHAAAHPHEIPAARLAFHRQPCAGHLLQETLQLIGAAPLRGRSVARNADGVGGLAAIGQHQLRGRRRQRQRHANYEPRFHGVTPE